MPSLNVQISGQARIAYRKVVDSHGSSFRVAAGELGTSAL
jgi:hypothetical protein